jgi:heme/copper-type cytochrome/quinol oxidase subunit 4
MGAMTAVMMINDNVKIAGIIVFAISIIILIGLSYMIHKETNESERYVKEDHVFTIFASLILISITALFMIMGPRSILFQ